MALKGPYTTSYQFEPKDDHRPYSTPLPATESDRLGSEVSDLPEAYTVTANKYAERLLRITVEKDK